MTFRIFLLRLVMGLLVLVLLGTALYVAYREVSVLDRRTRSIEHRLKRMEETTTRLAIQSDGFVPYSETRFKAITSGKPTLLFVGHIYPRNGLTNLIRTPDDPLGYLVAFSKSAGVERAIFGGDNVQTPSRKAWTHLRKLRDSFSSPVTYVMGNHDAYWASLSDKPEVFRELYGERYGYQDAAGVRLIHLHSIEQGGLYRLDDEQVEFLSKALDPDAYVYALVFLHHALWAGDTQVANTHYRKAAAAKAQWRDDILPLLRRGRVRGVFSGDGGWRKAGQGSEIAGIPHFVTGWSMRIDIPPEWLSITLLDDDIRVVWHRYFDGDHFVRY